MLLACILYHPFSPFPSFVQSPLVYLFSNTRFVLQQQWYKYLGKWDLTPTQAHGGAIITNINITQALLVLEGPQIDHLDGQQVWVRNHQVATRDVICGATWKNICVTPLDFDLSSCCARAVVTEELSGDSQGGMCQGQMQQQFG